MAVWVVRAGRQGEFEEFAIDNSVAGIDFELPKGVTEFPSREALRQYARGPHAAGQLWRFAHEVQVGETMVLPRKQYKVVAVGRITGPYRYEPDWSYPHIRPVEWAAVDIPRISFDQDLLYSFGGKLTVFQVNRTNCQERIDAVVRQHLGELPPAVSIPPADIAEDEPAAFDLPEAISDQIVERIRQKFTGSGMEHLVEEILKAQGYTTLQTRRGADGGIDIVAGKGEMGFAEPRLCVQVKSGSSPVDLPDYDRLQGNITNFSANHGLLVSLSDFTRAVRRENERSFFQIRLWGSEELIKNLVDTYDKLPSDIRADIPLADRKVLLETEV